VGPGTHSHEVPKLIGFDRATALLLLATLFVTLVLTTGMLLSARSAASRAAELAELTREQAEFNSALTADGVECILAELGQHRINSSDFFQSAAELQGFTYDRNGDLPPPAEGDVAAIQDACERFLPTSNEGAREPTEGGVGGG